MVCDAESLRRDGYDVTQAPLLGAGATATLTQFRSLALAVMRFTDTARKDPGVLHLVEVRHKSLRSGQPFQSSGISSRGMGMTFELNAVHVKRSLLPVRAAEQSVNRRKGRCSSTEEHFQTHFRIEPMGRGHGL